jgi:lipid A ethanolaminephosphotransferase
VLSRAIGELKKRPDLASALVYMSDHGESLGENGIYLHGWPYMVAPEQQTRVPFLAWLSRPFRDDEGIDSACLRSHADKGPYSHDNLFHSVLGLMDVRTAAYRREADVFAACRGLPRQAALADRVRAVPLTGPVGGGPPMARGWEPGPGVASCPPRRHDRGQRTHTANRESPPWQSSGSMRLSSPRRTWKRRRSLPPISG